MKTFIVTELRPAIAKWEYTIEAETEEEAVEIMLSQDFDKFECDHTVEIDYDVDADLIVETTEDDY